MLPTLRQLQYLKLLSEHGSFSRAAEAAHVTQPTLSAGIQELERILGSPLVDRNRSGVILTAAGTEAVVRAGVILANAEDLVQACRGAGQPLTGRFRLGVIPTIAPFMLPAALPALRARFPKLRLFLREDLTHRLIHDLKAGLLDAAVIALPYDMTGLDWAHVDDDELMAALPADHPLGEVLRIAPQSFEREELILLEDGHCLRDHALAACGLGGQRFTRDEGFAATSLATLVQMVGSGLGVSFLPAMAVESGLADAAHVTVRPLDAADMSREVVVAWRAGSTRATEGRLLADVFAQSRAAPCIPAAQAL
jgi:LysR family hydrogen peroxide-inducible transcriptional activator